MTDTPETRETKWFPVLFLTAVGTLLLLLPQFLPYLILDLSSLLSHDDADGPRFLGEILTGLGLSTYVMLQALLIRDLMLRFSGWRMLLPFSLTAFILDSVVLAPSVCEIEFSTSKTGWSALYDVVSSTPVPTTYWWMLPGKFMLRLSNSLFLICVTELFFPHHRHRSWLSGWSLCVCGSLTAVFVFVEFFAEVTYTRAEVTFFAFSWVQAVLGTASAIGILIYGLKNTRRTTQSPPGNVEQACPTPAQCAAGGIIFFGILFAVSFTETFIAGFSGSYFFRNNIARLLRASADVTLLFLAFRLLSAAVQTKGWSDRQLIGLLLGGYTAWGIYTAQQMNIFEKTGPVLRWTPFIVNLAATMLAVILFRWLWKHPPLAHADAKLQ